MTIVGFNRVENQAPSTITLVSTNNPNRNRNHNLNPNPCPITTPYLTSTPNSTEWRLGARDPTTKYHYLYLGVDAEYHRDTHRQFYSTSSFNVFKKSWYTSAKADGNATYNAPYINRQVFIHEQSSDNFLLGTLTVTISLTDHPTDTVNLALDH